MSFIISLDSLVLSSSVALTWLVPSCLVSDIWMVFPRLPRLVGGRVAGARADRQLVAVVEGGGTEALVLTAAGEVAAATLGT